MKHATEVTEQEARALATRLGLPHTGFLLHRPRLCSAAAPVGTGGVLSLVAGPGCGKTALITDLLSSATGRRFYLALEEGDRDPVRLVEYLKASVGTSQPETAQVSPDWTGSGTSNDQLAQMIEEMLRSLEAQKGDRCLMAIDDIHHLEASPSAILAVELLVRGLPPGWTLILASRKPLPFKLDRVALGGRLVELNGRYLRLTPSEIGAWAKKNWDIDLALPDTRALWRLTNGWPAALVLLGQRLLSAGPRVTHHDVSRVIAQGRDLRAYIEEHVVEGLGDLSAEVMLTAGLLPRVALSRDEGIFTQSRAVVRRVLDELVAKGLFVTRWGRDSYIVHPLVRAFAERKLLKRGDGAALLARVAEHLEAIQEHYHAARLYLLSDHLIEADRPLRAMALSNLDVAASLARERWSGLISGDISPETEVGPWYLVCKARMKQQEGHYPEASHLYEKATRLLSANGDREGLLLTLLSSAFCLYMRSRWKESLAVLERAHKVARTEDERAEVLLVEGQILISLCRWDEAVENWEKALVLVPEERHPAVAHRVHLGRAKLFHSMGHYALGKQWAERAIETEGGAGRTTRVMALHGASMLACVSGDYETAERLWTEATRSAEAHGLTFIRVLGLLTEVDLSLGRWDYRNAVAKCREAQRSAKKSGDAECAYWAEQMLGDICRCNRNTERALEHHSIAADMAKANGLAVSEQTRSKAAEGMDLIVMGREAESFGVLEDAAGISRQWGLKASLVPSLFYLGWIHAKNGREHEAGRCLGEAMRVAEEHEHIHFFNQEARVAVPIFALCDRFGCGSFLREKVIPLLPDRLREYFLVLAEGEAYPTDFALGAPKSGRTTCAPSVCATPLASRGEAGACVDTVAARVGLLTEREKEVLKAIAGGMPNKIIGARLFISEKTVKTHANNIFRKLGVSSRIQAVLVFQSHQRSVAAGSALRHRRR